MPPNHGIWSNDGERAAGFRKQVAGPTQNDPVDSQKWHPIWLAPSQHDDLLFEHQDFGFQSMINPKISLNRSHIQRRIVRFSADCQPDQIYDRDGSSSQRESVFDLTMIGMGPKVFVGGIQVN